MSSPIGSLFTPEALLRVIGSEVLFPGTSSFAGVDFGISPTSSRKSVWKLSGTLFDTGLLNLGASVSGALSASSTSNSVSDKFISAGS